MIYLMGDIHGYLPAFEFIAKNGGLTQNDFLIVLGDFGFVWADTAAQRKKIRYINSLPYNTLFIDGNHENFDLLYSYEIKEFMGGRVHVVPVTDEEGKTVESKIFHLMRGEIFNIEGNKIFTFGGGLSIDKKFRQPETEWWPQEYASKEEKERAAVNLRESAFEVDYVLTHTGTQDMFEYLWDNNIMRRLPIFTGKAKDETSIFLQSLIKKYRLKYKKWYCGHYHVTYNIDEKHTCLYNTLRKLGN